MAYEKKTWVDRQSEYPGRRKLTATGTADVYDVAREEGLIVEEGDALNAQNLNALEGRIETGLGEKADASHTHAPGDLTAAVPVSKGGTGAATAADARAALGVAYGTAAGTVCQGNDSRLSNARTPTAHNQAASTITAGTLPAGVVATNSTDYGTSRLRNIRASTTDLTAGTSALSNGELYLVYE